MQIDDDNRQEEAALQDESASSAEASPAQPDPAPGGITPSLSIDGEASPRSAGWAGSADALTISQRIRLP